MILAQLAAAGLITLAALTSSPHENFDEERVFCASAYDMSDALMAGLDSHDPVLQSKIRMSADFMASCIVRSSKGLLLVESHSSTNEAPIRISTFVYVEIKTGYQWFTWSIASP